MREVGVLAEFSVTDRFYGKFSNLGKLSMLKHCVPGSFLPTHAREPGNKAKLNQTYLYRK